MLFYFSPAMSEEHKTGPAWVVSRRKRSEEVGKGYRRMIQWKCCTPMHVNRKMTSVETIPGTGAGE
jgi:hypothetical protein